MISTLLLHTPPWVWALLVALLALGLRLSRARAVTPLQLVALPAVLLVLGAASSIAAFAAHVWLLLVWGKALLSGVALGRRLPAPASRWDGARLHVAASAWPLVIILTLFTLRYAGGVVHALHLAWAQGTLAMGVQTALYGALSGLLAGRTLALWQRTRGTTIEAHAQPRHA